MYQVIIFSMPTGAELPYPFIGAWHEAMQTGAALSAAGFIFFLREV